MLPITEQDNPSTKDIDKLPVIDALRLINAEDKKVAEGVELVLPEIAAAVELIVRRLENGGKLYYIGTGTSGRLGVLDASEVPPTYGVSPDLVTGVIAGGYDALFKAAEASEDDKSAGVTDLKAAGITGKDAVVGIAASGRTPYTVAALEFSRELGCLAVGLTSVPDSPIAQAAELAIIPVVGPEVITGSTRMKAGTAQKMVLNMISTMVMIRLGYVTGNHMTNLRSSNAKLAERGLRVLMDETGLSGSESSEILERSGGDLRIAIVMAKTGSTRKRAEQALAASAWVIGKAVDNISRSE